MTIKICRSKCLLPMYTVRITYKITLIGLRFYVHSVPVLRFSTAIIVHTHSCHIMDEYRPIRIHQCCPPLEPGSSAFIHSGNSCFCTSWNCRFSMVLSVLMQFTQNLILSFDINAVIICVLYCRHHIRSNRLRME